MKIGTKANAIDDLGKFDGSKMTIKVNGKQIYPQKRYAIIEVDYESCPIKYNIPHTYKNRCILHNENCEQCGSYGDTKEQLIRKVAQVRLKQKIKRWYAPFLEPSKLTIEFVYEKCLKEAKEIVEFLGVE